MNQHHRPFVFFAVFALAAFVMFSGPAYSGQLEPTDPPAPTMKSLDEIPPVWSQILDSTDGDVDGCNSSRFKCVLADTAVLDLETGLVWQRELEIIGDWPDAIGRCSLVDTGGRLGWRVPRIEELKSLADPADPNPGILPTGHPFTSVPPGGGNAWSSTTDPVDTTRAAAFRFADRFTDYLVKGDGTTNCNPPGPSCAIIWCVRGGTGTSLTSQPVVAPAP